MKFSGGWGGAGTSSFLPTGSSEWEEGPHGPALEVPLEDRMMIVVLSDGVEWEEGPNGSSGVI